MTKEQGVTTDKELVEEDEEELVEEDEEEEMVWDDGDLDQDLP